MLHTVHPIIDRLNHNGVQVCWAQELTRAADDEPRPAVWVSNYRLLVLNANASAGHLMAACAETLGKVVTPLDPALQLPQ